jgi:hypothetical protein
VKTPRGFADPALLGLIGTMLAFATTSRNDKNAMIFLDMMNVKARKNKGMLVLAFKLIA